MRYKLIRFWDLLIQTHVLGYYLVPIVTFWVQTDNWVVVQMNNLCSKMHFLVFFLSIIGTLYKPLVHAFILIFLFIFLHELFQTCDI